ncbi:MAG: peptidoglycan DD-metalloendopeptidase family protein [Proteobacteria bacterium]|nr:peptidoglycan DD-metalloendopeptidase family protein [Pseudomonadota bacterium]
MTQITNTITIITCYAILVLSSASNAAVTDDSNTAKASELENLRIRIKDVETRIKGARDETDKLQKELRENEITTAETLTRLHNTELNISNKHAELEELMFEQAENEASLEQEKEILTNQIRSAYQVGRNDYIKLVLNQEDPALVGRALAYYDYHNQARSERIEQVKQSLVNLEQIQSSIVEQTTKLESLKAEHEIKLRDFHQYRATRRDIITRLQKYIEEQGVELHTLQENERELGKLFQGLKQEEAVTIEMFEDMPPFNVLKGKLTWPVKGKILKRFGAGKKKGNLKWQGVLIDAETGIRVNAISTGKIVFADWFRNLGLLIIIDHGDGYMSLYGHNQNLLKNTGDRVLADEKIATVGDSGGQSNTALYFEIRKDAEPLNPAHWCKK